MTNHRRLALLAVTAATTVTTAAAGVAVAQAAVVACSVRYQVSSQWPGGFTADLTLTNLGDPLQSWQLGWSYLAGQRVTQAWNATVTQNGSQVTAANASWNGAIGTNDRVGFGFNGAWSGSNPVPNTWTLNGVVCSGPVPVTPTVPATPPNRSARTSPTTSGSIRSPIRAPRIDPPTSFTGDGQVTTNAYSVTIP
jgi:hypothetical protein